jgi:hypothetical protein
MVRQYGQVHSGEQPLREGGGLSGQGGRYGTALKRPVKSKVPALLPGAYLIAFSPLEERSLMSSQMALS